MRKLYVLPFDHRGSFIKMFGFSAEIITAGDVAKLKDYKHVVYEGFLGALELGVRKEEGAILVDEEFGAEIHEEARKAGITRMLTVEKSGQDEFDFEYGDVFREHINKLKPEYAKVLVRYNPESDAEMNCRQVSRLKTLGDFCRESGYKFTLELLAFPIAKQLEEQGGREGYDRNLRREMMKRGIAEIKAGGVEPDIWKLEGLENKERFTAVVEVALHNTKKETGVIVLGRGESEEKVRVWLTTAAKIPGVIGMAVGRTIFSQPLLDLAAGKIERGEAAQTIAKNYKGFIDIFEEAR